jgi:hypothetical protein
LLVLLGYLTLSTTPAVAQPSLDVPTTPFEGPGSSGISGGRDIVIWERKIGAARLGLGAAGGVGGRGKYVARGMIRYAYSLLPRVAVFAQAEYVLTGTFGAMPRQRILFYLGAQVRFP